MQGSAAAWVVLGLAVVAGMVWWFWPAESTIGVSGTPASKAQALASPSAAAASPKPSPEAGGMLPAPRSAVVVSSNAQRHIRLERSARDPVAGAQVSARVEAAAGAAQVPSPSPLAPESAAAQVGLALPAGATPREATAWQLTGQRGESRTLVTISSEQPMEALLAYYRAQMNGLAARGGLAEERTVGPGQHLLTASWPQTQESRSVLLTQEPGASGVQVQLAAAREPLAR